MFYYIGYNPNEKTDFHNFSYTLCLSYIYYKTNLRYDLLYSVQT
jgi:hypothetical protein